MFTVCVNGTATKLNKTVKIRIQDIADRAGVSIGTVDRVLHKRGEVKKETRDKVLEIVKALDYTPNLSAKSLATKKPHRFAVVIPYAADADSYWNKPMEGITKAASEIADYNSVLEIFTFDAYNLESYEDALKKVLNTELQGVVFQPLFGKAALKFTKKLDQRNIPYVYIDMNLEQGNKLAYLGQNAEQSGRVAAKIFSASSPFKERSKILIVKCDYKGFISHHLEKRAKGFIGFLKNETDVKWDIVSLEIDLFEKNQPQNSLSEILNKDPEIKGIFVPNSRVFHVAEFLSEKQKSNMFLLGYDLIDRNIDYLNDGVIDYLISQKPEEQGYKSVMTLFKNVVAKKAVSKMNYSSIDIIIKENIEYYN